MSSRQRAEGLALIRAAQRDGSPAARAFLRAAHQVLLGEERLEAFDSPQDSQRTRDRREWLRALADDCAS